MPLSYEGRVQPFDSLARNALKVLRGRESALLVEKKNGEDVETTIKPVPWLLDVFTRKEISKKYKIFRLDHPDVKSLLGLDDKEKYFSVEDIGPNFEKSCAGIAGSATLSTKQHQRDRAFRHQAPPGGRGQRRPRPSCASR